MLTRFEFTRGLAGWLGITASPPLERLGQITALAGPNGSGKTRHLYTISRALQCARKPNLGQFQSQLAQAQSSLGKSERYLSEQMRLGAELRAAQRSVEDARRAVANEEMNIAFETAVAAQPFVLEPAEVGVPECIQLFVSVRRGTSLTDVRGRDQAPAATAPSA